jgi:hypothetical protein
LAEHKQAQTRLQLEREQLQQELEVQRQKFVAEQASLGARTRELEARGRELAAAQTRLEEESLQRRKLVEQVVEVERAKTELTNQVAAADNRIKSQEHSIQTLATQIQERQRVVDRLEASLQSEIDQRRKAQGQIGDLEQQAAGFSNQLAEKRAAEQRWLQRESELDQSIRQQQEQLADAASAADIQEGQLNRLRARTDDQDVIQSALCAQVRALTAQHDDANRKIHELDARAQAATQTIQDRDQELAALRHAILDAARIGNHISRERRQVDGQAVVGWQRLITTLLETPLSVAQRGLLTEIIGALDGWRKQADARTSVEFHVEPPDLRHAEFNCPEVIKSALAAIQKHMGIQASVAGSLPEGVRGNPQHLHHLVTTLVTSLPEVAGAQQLEVQLSCNPQQDGSFKLLVSIFFTATDADAACLRLTRLAEASATFQTLQGGGAELALTSAWQLALALGGRPTVATGPDQKVHVQITLSPRAKPKP